MTDYPVNVRIDKDFVNNLGLGYQENSLRSYCWTYKSEVLDIIGILYLQCAGLITNLVKPVVFYLNEGN